MENKFEQASRLMLRYKTSGGTLNTEDLWTLNLESLNTLAKAYNKQIKEAEEEDFLKTQGKAAKELELAFAIVKHILDVKKAEKEEKAIRVEKANKKARIQEILDKKKDGALEAKSIEELEAELAGM